MKFRDEAMPICTTENIPLFVMYIKKELPKDQEAKLNRHIEQCSDCKANLVYIEEIVHFRHPLSIDEKSLLLKYISDPLWYYSINTIKKQLLGEVLDEVKTILKESDTKALTANPTTLTPSNASSDKSLPNSLTTTNLNKNTRQKYSSVVLTLTVATFFILTGFIVVATNNKYPIIETFLPSSSVPSFTSSNQQATEANLYQQLDSAIDEFLSTKKEDNISKASIIAKEIEEKYQDKYGVDLVSYYQDCPQSTHSKLLGYRKQLRELLDSVSGDKYEVRLQKAKLLLQDLKSVNNTIEAYKVKTFVAKLYVLNFNHSDYKPLIDEGIAYTTDKNYTYLKAHFLLWKAKYNLNTTNYLEAEKLFEEVLKITTLINLDEVTASASMSLAGIYHNNNEDEKALSLCQKSMLLVNSKPSTLISLLQISGLSAFNLKLHPLSETYFEQAIGLAEKHNNHFLLALSYTFLANVASEKQDFDKAEELFNKAILTTSSVDESTSRIDLLSRINGYQAKTKLMQKDYKSAAMFYQQTLTTLNKLGIQSNLEVSQLNEGLALALKQTGNKDFGKYQMLAQNYSHQAQTKKESLNCLLSFLPVQCR